MPGHGSERKAAESQHQGLCATCPVTASIPESRSVPHAAIAGRRRAKLCDCAMSRKAVLRKLPGIFHRAAAGSSAESRGWRIHRPVCMRRLIRRLTGCALDTGGAFGRARGRRHEGSAAADRRHPRSLWRVLAEQSAADADRRCPPVGRKTAASSARDEPASSRYHCHPETR
jgi:hypothetical protein